MCLDCEKFKISKESYNALVRAGRISTTWPAHEEIFLYYKQCLSRSKSVIEAIEKVCEDKRVSERTVYYIIDQFK